MKLNKFILEAINRGILLALDDYEDIEDNSSISSDVIDTEDVIKERMLKNFVDLDLPSGTLWAKYNLGVDPKKINNPIYWYGDYYQWGETNPVFNPLDDGYISGKINVSNFSSSYALYDKRYNNIDKLTELLPDDDPASVKYKSSNYHTPTIELFLELKDNTTKKWVTNYQSIKGLDGLLLIGKNGNEIFFPANGFIAIGYNNARFEFMGESPYVWTKTHYTDNRYTDGAHYGPHCMSYHNSNSLYDYISLDWMVREHAAGIRPVYNKK